MGFKHVFLVFISFLFFLPLYGAAVANKRALIIDKFIYLSPHQASLFYGFGCALFALGAFYMVCGLIRSVILPMRIELSDGMIALPKGVFRFGLNKIPYASITSVQERRHRRKLIGLILHAGRRRFVIQKSLLSDRGYEEVKRHVLGRAGRSWPPRAPGQSTAPVSQITPKKSRGSLAGLAGGLTLIVLGAYYIVIQLQASSTPTEISIGEFENHPPDNRNVIITGGYFDFAHAVKYELFHFPTDKKPETTYFVPLDDSPPGPASAVPKVIVKISDSVLQKERATLTGSRIHGMRMTQWEFDHLVRTRMRQSFGDAVDNMIVVEYGSRPIGVYLGLGLMAAGVVFLFIRSRK